MKVITICNSKGGVGKTTTTLALGSILQDKGYKVLYIDTDSQCNLTEILGGNINTINLKTLYDNYRLDINQTIQELDNSTHLIAASPELDSLDLKQRKNIDFYLKDRLRTINNKYDYVLIDTPPHLSYLYVNMLMASNYVIVTGKADILSYRGIQKTLSNIQEVQNHNESLKVLGVLLTQFSYRSNLDQAIKDNLKGVTKEYNTKVFNTYIRQCKTLSLNQLLQKPITSNKACNGYKDYLRFTNEMLKDIKKEG